MDDLAVGGGLVDGTEAEEGLEGGQGRAAPVVAEDVGSGRGAVSAFRLVRFPDPPTEPGVHVSAHRALHKSTMHYAAVLSVLLCHGEAMLLPR